MHPATNGSHDRLVFAQFQWDWHLYRFNEGRAAEQVAPSSSFESDPGLSPDGRWMAFVSGRSGNVALWVASADGTNARQVTHDARQYPGSPAWSPDGTVIAFDMRNVPLRRTSGRSTRKVARHASSRQGQAIRRPPHGRATAHGSITPASLRAPATSGACERPEAQPRTGDADRQRLLSHMSSPTGRASCTSRRAPTLRCYCCRSPAPLHHGGWSTASERRPSLRPAAAIVYVPCASGSNPPLHALDPVSRRTVCWGRSSTFLRVRRMSTLP